MYEYIARKTVLFAAAAVCVLTFGLAVAAESTTGSDKAAVRSDSGNVPNTNSAISNSGRAYDASGTFNANKVTEAARTYDSARNYTASDMFGASDAAKASRNIDQSLQRTASEFNDELNRSTNQFHEAQRLGTSPDVRNRFGTASSIDNEISRTADKANAELRDAATRDDYTFRRRELENTRNLTYPGTPEYNSLTNDIEKLDRDFVNQEREYVW